jgi:hypothetical protein
LIWSIRAECSGRMTRFPELVGPTESVFRQTVVFTSIAHLGSSGLIAVWPESVGQGIPRIRHPK